MATTVTRKEYNAEGSEVTSLGLPYEEVTTEYDGAVKVGGLSIDDAFNTDEVVITDDHSTGLVALVGEIAKVQQQERCMPSDILMPTIKGFPIDSEGKTDWDGEETEDTLTEVTPVEPIYVGGILVKHLYKSSGGVSYWEPSDSALMDGRKSMVGYGVEKAADVVYKILPASYATDRIKALLGVTEVKDDVSVDAESGMFDAECEITAKSNYLLGTFARVNLDAMLGLAAVFVGINGGVPSWMVEIHSLYGCPISVLAKYPNVGKVYQGKGYMYKDGLAYFSPSDLYANPDIYVEFDLTPLAYGEDNQLNMFGGRKDGNTDKFNIVDSSSWSYLRFAVGTSDGSIGPHLTIGERAIYALRSGCGSLIKDGTTTNYTNTGTITSTYSWLIAICGFRNVSKGIVESRGTYKFHGFKTYKYSTMEVEHYWLPCADDTLLDLVTGETLTNQGTGTATLVIE